MRVRILGVISGQPVHTAVVVNHGIWVLLDNCRNDINVVQKTLFRELKPITLCTEYATYITTDILQVLVMSQCDICVADLR